MSNLNKIFEEAVQSLMTEASAAPEDIIDTKGALGQGRHNLGIGVGKSRAEIEPKGLMKDLGVRSSGAGQDLKKCANILMQAITNNPTMKQAFEKPIFMKKPLLFVEKRRGKKPIYREEIIDVVIVPINEDIISYRNAVLYVALTLEGAYNADILDLHGKVKFRSEQKGARVPMFYSISFEQ